MNWNALKCLCLAVCMAGGMVSGVAADSKITGAWRGKLTLNQQNFLNLVFHFQTAEDGSDTFTFDSPDQGAYGMAGEVCHLTGDSVHVTIRQIGMSFEGRREGEKIVGTFRQSGLAVVMELEPGNVVQRRPQTPKAPYPYTVKEVTISHDAGRVSLAGTLTLPPGHTARTPAVVLVSGSGLQNRDEEIFGHKPFAVMADYLARNGVASLRYDDRGFGQSTGDGETATTADFTSDAKAAMDYLRRVEGFERVGVWGHSEGAVVAFSLAADEPAGVAAHPAFIVAMGAPAVRGDSILADQSAVLLRQSGVPEKGVNDYVEALRQLYAWKIAGISPDELRSRIEALCSSWEDTPVAANLKANLLEIVSKVTDLWLDSFIRYSPAESIAATHCPTLVLYGGKDIQVSPKLNMPPMQRLASRASVRLYPDCNHLFQHARTGTLEEYGRIEETIAPEVLRDVLAFIASSCPD